MESPYKYLQEDSQLLGCNTAVINLLQKDSQQLESLLRDLKKQQIVLVYYFVDPADHNLNQLACRHGGKLVDTKVTFSRALNENTDEYLDNSIELFTQKETPQSLIDLVLQSGIYSRYRTDSQMPLQAFSTLYSTWINRSIKREIADTVFVYKQDNLYCGLITLSNKKMVASIGLLGVDEKYRGQGIGKKLVQYSMNYLVQRDCKTLEVATQEVNGPACSFYRKLGFEIIKRINVYHFWL